MSIRIKKILVAVCLVTFAICLFATANLTIRTANASNDSLSLADYTSTFVMEKGASVRVGANAGIRFTSSISKSQYDALTQKYGEDQIKMGTLIAPKDLLNGRELSLTSGLILETEYVNVERQVWGAKSDDTTYYFNAVLSDLQPHNYDRTFVARSYITVGSETVYAGEFDQDGRSPAFVANAAKLEDGVTGTLIDAYINSVDSYTDLSFNVEENITLHVGETVTINATITGKKEGKDRLVAVFPDLTSNNSNVTIDKNTITGVLEGTTVLTATANGMSKDINVTVKSPKVLANGTYLSYENSGADFNLNIPTGEKARILQLSDTQIIDVTNSPDGRLPATSEGKWADLEANLFSYMDYVVEKSDPHFIVLAGDNVYGEFDTEFNMLTALIEKLDSYGVYWAFVFGNHDREVDVNQIMAKYANSEYCLYKSNVSFADSNYTVNIKQDGEYIRTIYLLDTNFTYNSGVNTWLVKQSGMTSEQLNWLDRTKTDIANAIGEVPATVFMHVKTKHFYEAAVQQYGYEVGTTLEITENNAKNGDFGCIHGDNSKKWEIAKEDRFLSIIKSANVDSVNVGHNHENNASILYDGIRWTYGLKTGTFDDYKKAELGGTLLSLDGKTLAIEHVYAVDGSVENMENLTIGDSRHAYGSVMDFYSSEEIALSVTDKEDELPENGSGKALKGERVHDGGDSYNFVCVFTGVSFEQGKSYKITFNFKTNVSGTYYAQLYTGNEVFNTYSDIAQGTNRYYFTADKEYSSVNIYIGSGAGTADYIMYLDNVSVVETIIPEYETFDDMYVSGNIGYGTHLRIDGKSACVSWELVDNGDGKALKIVDDGTINQYDFIRLITNQSLKNGNRYLIEFDLNIINGTYGGILQLMDGDSGVVDIAGVNTTGHHRLMWIATKDVKNLFFRFSDGVSANAYEITIDNFKVVECVDNVEDYENANVYGKSVYGDITTTVSNISWLANSTVSISNDDTYRPANSTGDYMLIDVTNSDSTYTWINFRFGAVEANTAYTFNFTSKNTDIVGGIDSLTLRVYSQFDEDFNQAHTSGYTLKTVENLTLGDFSYTITFDQAYTDVTFALQVVCKSNSDHVILAFDNVSLTKAE